MLELLLSTERAKALDMSNSKIKVQLKKHLSLQDKKSMEESSELMLQVNSKRKKISDSEIETQEILKWIKKWRGPNERYETRHEY